MDSRAISSNLWAWYLAAVVFATQYYVVSAYGATPNDDLATWIGATGLIAAVVGLAVHRPPRFVAWAAIAGSIGAYLAADAIYAQLVADHPIPPFPSVADWLYLGIYPVLVVSFAIVRRALAPGVDRAATVDAVLIGIAALGVLGPLYLFDLWNSPFLDTTQQRVLVAYPIADAVLVGAAARLVLAAGRRVNALTLLAAAALAVVVGNAVYNVAELGDGFATGGVGSVGWLAFTCLLGAALLHPSVRFAGTSAAAAKRPWPTGVRVAAAASVVAAHLAWGDDDSRVLTVCCLVAVLIGGALAGRLRSRTRTLASTSTESETAPAERASATV